MKYTIIETNGVINVEIPQNVIVIGINRTWYFNPGIRKVYFTKFDAFLEFANNGSNNCEIPMCGNELVADANRMGRFNVIRNMIRNKKLQYYDYAGSAGANITQIMAGHEYVELNAQSAKIGKPKDQVIETKITEKKEEQVYKKNSTGPKVSIVMAYQNRRELLTKTLDTIRMSAHSNIEIIIVDDCSLPGQEINDFEKKYEDLGVRVIMMDRSKRWYVNPCVPYNVGIRAVSGEIVIIQNPECMHYDDVISHAVKNLGKYDYFSYTCFPADQDATSDILRSKCESYADIANLGITKTMNDTHVSWHENGHPAWYTHSIYRPAGYHFASAVYKKALDLVGGFDESFAMGMAFDDDAFVYAVKKSGLNFHIIDECKVIHLEHPKYAYDIRLWEKNNKIFEDIKNKKFSTKSTNNIWIYWENAPGKYMPKYIAKCRETLYKNCGNDFNIHIVTPHNISYYLPNINEKYKKFEKIAHRADYIRYCLLYEFGGIWLDSDFIIFKSLAPIIENIKKHGFVYSGYISSKNEVQPLIAFLGALPKNDIVGKMIDGIHKKCFIPEKYEIKWDEIGNSMLRSYVTENNSYYYDTKYFYPVHVFNSEKNSENHSELFYGKKCPDLTYSYGCAFNNSVANLKIEMTYDSDNIIRQMFDIAMGITRVKFGVAMSTYSDENTSKSRYKIIDECLESVVKYSSPNTSIYVIVDGSATEEHMQILKKHKCTLIFRNKRGGIGACKNTGIKMMMDIRCDFFFLIDDDLIFKKSGWEKAYYDAYVNTGIEHFNMFIKDRTLTNQWGIEQNNYKKTNVNGFYVNSYVDTECNFGCFLAMTPNVVNNIGYFKKMPYFYGHEHRNFTMRYIKHFNSCYYDILNSEEYIMLNCKSNDAKSISHIDYSAVTENEKIAKDMSYVEFED